MKISMPAKQLLSSKTGTVARLVDRLLQQNPTAQVRFAIEDTLTEREYQLLSVYSDDNGIVWVDIG